MAPDEKLLGVHMTATVKPSLAGKPTIYSSLRMIRPRRFRDEPEVTDEAACFRQANSTEAACTAPQ
jgi:hypothetical protein